MLSRKEGSPRSVGALTEAKQNCVRYNYTSEFTEKQAEIIFKRDTKILYIGASIVAVVLLFMEVLLC